MLYFILQFLFPLFSAPVPTAVAAAAVTAQYSPPPPLCHNSYYLGDNATASK